MRTAHSTAPHAAPPQRRSAAPQTWDIPSRPPASTRSAAHRTARRGRPPRRPAAYVPGAIPRGALALSIRNNWEQEFFRQVRARFQNCLVCIGACPAGRWRQCSQTCWRRWPRWRTSASLSAPQRPAPRGARAPLRSGASSRASRARMAAERSGNRTS